MAKTREIAEVASGEVKQVNRELGSLRRELDKLYLISLAMWEMLQERDETLTDEDLLAKMKEIDERDGTIDGTIPRVPDNCPDCGRPVSLKNNLCIYCDIHVERKTPF